MIGTVYNINQDVDDGCYLRSIDPIDIWFE